MSYECDQKYESGSQCSFSCPEPLRLNGTDQTTCNDGAWSEIAPFCCMGKFFIFIILWKYLDLVNTFIEEQICTNLMLQARTVTEDDKK